MALSVAGAGFRSLASDISGQKSWRELPGILGRITPPRFPTREFEITKFGAVGDGNSDCTLAFADAVGACNKTGGGVVVVRKGTYLTGAVRLRSHVNLHIERGASIRFSRDPAKYPTVRTRFEGVELMNYSPFIYAFEEENIAVTGSGTLDGNADPEHWWPWKIAREKASASTMQDDDRRKLFAMAEGQVPVEQRIFGPGHFLRPNFIQPYRCKNVLIEGVTLVRSPMWEVHPVLSSNVIVRGLTINTFGPNNDGCDPESCRDVLIENCFFNTGDDCIAIKSGRNEDGRRLNAAAANIVVRGCRMKGGHGGVTIGSEVSGGVRNVFAENCRMDSPHLYSAVRIKTNAMRGGDIEHIYARNIDVGEVSLAGLSIDFNYEEGESGKFTPVVRDVQLDNVNARNAQYAVYLRGLANAPIEDVKLTDCDFQAVQKQNVIEHARDVSFHNVRINGVVLGAHS